MATSLGLGLLAGAFNLSAAQKQRKAQKAALDKQAAAAREAAALSSVKENTGAEVVVGTGTTTKSSVSKKKTPEIPRSTVGSTVGGLSSSSLVGL